MAAAKGLKANRLQNKVLRFLRKEPFPEKDSNAAQAAGIVTRIG